MNHIGEMNARALCQIKATVRRVVLYNFTGKTLLALLFLVLIIDDNKTNKFYSTTPCISWPQLPYTILWESHRSHTLESLEFHRLVRVESGPRKVLRVWTIHC